ncbi:MAG: T9SS type A sorting domain-containing protein [Bacteroidota bacterium]
MINNCTLKFDSHDTAYVSYVDAFYSGKAVVKKFNGSSWATVGTPGFTAGGTGQMAMALNNNSLPYIAYQDQANGFAASSMMFDGANWVHVGNSTFSVAQCQFCHIAFDNTGTVPYICYNEGYNPFSPNVQKYNGSAWVYVGGQNLNTNVDYQNNIAIDGNNIPYVIFPDGAYSGKATVMNYNGSSWVTTGNAGFSTGEIWYPNIVTDALNNIFVEYYDAADSNKVSVMKFGNTNSVNEVNVNNTLLLYPNPSNSEVTIHFQNTSLPSQNSQLLFTDVFGKEIYKQVINQSETTIDVSNWSEGIYFYEIKGTNEIARGRFVKE